MPKANICLIGLSNQLIDQLGLELSKKLDMFYANVQKIIEFELFDMQKMQEICGKEYLERKESGILRRICTYENTVLSVEYPLINSDYNYDNLNNSALIIYVRLGLKKLKKKYETENITEGAKLINIDLFEDRDYICKRKADIVVDCDNLEENHIVDVIMGEIVKFYV